ncbi:uncharacterized protein FA14DRAFT_182206 [Meira miltonrushii]|uniref:Cyclin N-terminal domain-containing protein n=1 Tax=Meira miltonrushii TaxID=1280837 RepID=A0A316V9X5_9BASI|nr:uncharacterized protein FA14DRAFT_182206 [Meira miltonrushii]PWN32295.1 hypothetical protein FA14DRAFT_182206 [Meira miltonrushii]
MSAYQGHQYGDGQMTSNAANHGVYHPQYHPQEPMMHAPVGNGVNNVMSAQMAEEAAYYNMMNASRMDAGDYAAGGFMPLPQAPRLPVAAARATSMAAMYYDPTLHPQHAYSNNVSAPAPWAVPYYNPANGHAMGEYNPSAPFQHQHVEHQMMMHNQMSRSHQHPPQQQVDPHTYGSGIYSNPAQPITTDPSHLAAGNHHLDSNYAHNPVVSSASYYGLNAATASAAPQQFYDWEQQQFAGGADEYDPANAAAYHRNNATVANDPRRNLTSAGIRSEMTGSYGMPHGQGGEGVYGEFRNVHALDQPYHPANAQAGWPSTSYPGNGQWHDVNHRSQRHSMQHPHQRHPHHQPPPSSHGGNSMWFRKGIKTNEPVWTGHESSFPITSSQAQPNPHFVSEAQNWQHARPDQGYAPQHQMHPLQGQFNADVTAVPHAQFPPMDQNAIVPAPVQDAEAQKAPPAPAPPSPDTLDKSAVPVSSVGAEIIWVAAAALLDPGMWVRASLNINASNRNRVRSGSAMSETSSNPSPFTSPLTDSHDHWEQAMDMSTQDTDVSRASSSQQSAHRKNVKSNDPYDESSASSSEPGTPPTSIPSRIWEKDGRHEKQSSLSALHGMRALELSNDSRSSHRSVSPMNVQSPSQRSTFQRSASYDRAREAVVSITDLLDRDWRWSLNDDKLESLGQSQRPEAHQKVSNGRRSSSSSRREDNGVHGGGASMPGTEPSPAFRRFAHQVLAQTLVSPTAFMLSLMYSLRVLHLAIQTRSGKPSLDPEAAEIFAQPPSAAPFKLFTLGLMIANKHLDDNTFLNKTWNEVTGISLAELNRAERWYLEKSSYEITVPEETWVSFLKQLHLRTEHKISSLASAKRIRVPTKQAPDSLRRQDSYVVPHAGSEEAQKRFLLGIEDALQALGYDNVFDLAANNAQGREENNLHHCAPKPKDSLTHLHHNHHSAPAADLMRLSKNANQEGEFDVFEDENGPYRPHSASIRRLTANGVDGKDLIKKRSSQATLGGEAVLSRSVSDGITPTISCAHEQQRIQSKRESKAEMHAPLAPSVLLDLLNRGQHLAHAAH